MYEYSSCDLLHTHQSTRPHSSSNGNFYQQYQLHKFQSPKHVMTNFHHRRRIQTCPPLNLAELEELPRKTGSSLSRWWFVLDSWYSAKVFQNNGDRSYRCPTNVLGTVSRVTMWKRLVLYSCHNIFRQPMDLLVIQLIPYNNEILGLIEWFINSELDFKKEMLHCCTVANRKLSTFCVMMELSLGFSSHCPVVVLNWSISPRKRTKMWVWYDRRLG